MVAISKAKRNIRYSPQNGFTLIEMLIVMALISIIISIAVPNYHKYMLHSAEDRAKQKMLSLSAELEQWRAQSLSYRGFVPKTGYTDVSSGTINVPAGDPQYSITIGQVTGTPPAFSTLDTPVVRSNDWIMLATPILENNSLTGAKSFKLDSKGLRCATDDPELDLSTVECGAGQITW